MYHTCAYYVSIGQTALTDMTAVQDDILAIQNSHFLPQIDLSVRSIYLSSATMTRGQINSPKIRQINPSYIRPINQNKLPPTNPNIQRFDGEQLVIKAQEELQIQATSGLGSGNEDAFCILWLMVRDDPVPQGDVYWCYFTSTTTVTSQKWTTVSYTLNTLLPQGEYAMISSECQSTNGIAHRWIFSNQYWRPGHLMLSSLANRGTWDQYNFTHGIMGKFVTYDLPRLQILADGADASFEGYFAVARLGPPPAVPGAPMMSNY